jgi:regulator of sigma E protease
MQKNKGKKVPLVLERDGKRINTTAQLSIDGRLGFGFKLENKLERFVKYPGVSQAISGGTTRAFGTIFQNMQGMKKVASGEVSLDAMSGPLGMYRIFPPDWSLFWINIAMLSMWLAFINFLPIPALDGGHAMFLTIEMVSGRKIPEKFLEYAQMVGMILLLGLMVLVLGLDIWKIVKSVISYFS